MLACTYEIYSFCFILFSSSYVLIEKVIESRSLSVSRKLMNKYLICYSAVPGSDSFHCN